MNLNSDLLNVGAVLDGGKYRIVRQIASGGFGNTYEAVNVKLNARCAIKELFVKGDTQRDSDSFTVCVSNAEKSKQFESLKRKFKDEAHRLSELKCEHIVQVYDLFDDNGTVYYVMELIEGNTLTEIMEKNNRTFSQDETVEVLSQMLDALEVVHDAGILHMDIKPSNIMMNHEGVFKLIDFGTSKQQTNDKSTDNYTTTIIAYSPGYAPSEQISGNKSRWGVWTDYYELGATTYHLLTGKRPPLSEDIQVDGEDAFSFPENVTPSMRKLVMWMMKPLYTERPQNIGEIRACLNQLDDNPQSSQQPIVIQEEPWIVVDEEDDPVVDINKPITDKKKKRITRWLIFLLLIPALLAGGIKLYHVFSPEDPLSNVENYIFSVGNINQVMVKIDGAKTEYGKISPFFIAKTEVTQKLWKLVMGNNPSAVVDEDRPVESVSWEDCLVFIHMLDSITGLSFRLPTETEWEWVAQLEEKKHNVDALTDNVAEWCFDIYAEIRTDDIDDPIGAEDGWFRVYRGLPHPNEWKRTVNERYYALKEFRDKSLGLRLVLNPEQHYLDINPKSAFQQNLLGVRYFYGMGIPQDYKKAAELFQKADSQSYTPASKNLASCLYYGIGTSKNSEKAAMLFKKAAENNVVSAQHSLAVCYLTGQGVPCDKKKAFSWFEKSANAGNPYAQYHLANLYYKGVGTTADKENAVNWFAKSADKGYAPAQYLLSLFYKNGIALEKNNDMAAKWGKNAEAQRFTR